MDWKAKNVGRKYHHWSGWPGAYCLDCGCEDPLEIGLVDNKEDEILEDMKTNPQSYECKSGFNKNCGQCLSGKE